MSEDLTLTVAEALKTVIDPELGYNIIDLGLVYDVVVGGGAACIRMTTTRPGCPATSALKHGAVEAPRSVPGVASVEVHMIWLPPWPPELMSETKAIRVWLTRHRGKEAAMDGGFVMIRMIKEPERCEDGLRLRQRLAKLRWMRLDTEADRLADEILHLDCERPRSLPRRIPATD